LAWATLHKGLFSLPSLRVDKWLPTVAGKTKAGIAHSACGWNAGCATKTVILWQCMLYLSALEMLVWRGYTNWLPLSLPFSPN